MKSLKNLKTSLLFFVTALFTNIYAFAQEEGGAVKVDVTRTETTTWYTNPWVWIIGVAVFILLFAAIVRGGRRTDA